MTSSCRILQDGNASPSARNRQDAPCEPGESGGLGDAGLHGTAPAPVPGVSSSEFSAMLCRPVPPWLVGTQLILTGRALQGSREATPDPARNVVRSRVREEGPLTQYALRTVARCI